MFQLRDRGNGLYCVVPINEAGEASGRPSRDMPIGAARAELTRRMGLLGLAPAARDYGTEPPGERDD